MPEFKVKCKYIGVEKKKFFRDQVSVEYHRFLVENPEQFPHQCFHSSTRLGKDDFNPDDLIIYCVIFISDNLLRNSNLDFKYNWWYRFIMNLQEPKTADFTIYYNIPPLGGQYEEHFMVLKTKQYFKNTVQKIGFWDSENYFYEASKKKKSPQPANQSTNQNRAVKITLVFLLLLMPGLFFLCLIKLISKRIKTKNK